MKLTATVTLLGHPEFESFGEGGMAGVQARMRACIETHPTLGMKVESLTLREAQVDEPLVTPLSITLRDPDRRRRIGERFVLEAAVTPDDRDRFPVVLRDAGYGWTRVWPTEPDEVVSLAELQRAQKRALGDLTADQEGVRFDCTAWDMPMYYAVVLVDNPGLVWRLRPLRRKLPCVSVAAGPECAP